MVHWIEYVCEAMGGLQHLFGIPQSDNMDMECIWTLLVRTFGTCAVFRTLQSFVFISLLRITCRTTVARTRFVLTFSLTALRVTTVALRTVLTYD